MRQIKARGIFVLPIIGMIMTVTGMVALSLARQEPPAREIIARSWEKFRGAKTEVEKADIQVIYASGKLDEKALIRWTKYDENGDRVAIEFTAPARQKGLKLLIWRNPGHSDNIWLKMPSWNRDRAISSRDESRFFADTDFTYRDTCQLAGENLPCYRYELLDSNARHWIIQALPTPEIRKVYDKRIFHIDKDNFVIEKIEYYKGGKIEKTQYNQDIQLYEGAWRSNRVIIENHFQKRKTQFLVLEREFDSEIPTRLFTKSFLR